MQHKKQTKRQIRCERMNCEMQEKMTMKNWYGLLGGRRNQLHQDIHNVIADLAFMVAPTLVILDASRVLTRNGPTGGSLADVKAGDAIVAGIDQVAVDAYGCETFLDLDLAQVEYLQRAHDRGIEHGHTAVGIDPIGELFFQTFGSLPDGIAERHDGCHEGRIFARGGGRVDNVNRLFRQARKALIGPLQQIPLLFKLELLLCNADAAGCQLAIKPLASRNRGTTQKQPGIS